MRRLRRRLILTAAALWPMLLATRLNAMGQTDGKPPMDAPHDMQALARQMMARAYAPYSKFHVGAVMRGAGGKLYGGCNVENAAYPDGCCAETSAISAMVADGEHHIAEVVVMGVSPEPVTPCGACRQRIREFAANDVKVWFCDATATRGMMTLGQLLPMSFGPANLAINR
jgi:cytidine deaminase